MVRKQIVYIRWLDSSYNSGCFTQEELEKKEKNYILEDIGWLAHEDKDFVTFAASWIVNDKEWRHVWHIPRGMILEKHYMTFPPIDGKEEGVGQ